ncbi:MAG TPA: DUF378 domain-containing protein [Candidatus Pseudogracilibacillus intestinigallinarum]|uniref:DUF378 domain-containing protein n=1 Tax=Candidatus Pseudogracilibacillus intestinigallinarum TaxID=2838742 RepID=A0A9D1TLJ6_9BACI|nr:DUF378 domain-containing protein [Candidatus Pseudogracilibacillus intestinigallinarum]
MNWSQILALILVIIGAINWGLIGLFQFDLVASIFGGQGAILSRIIYALVGLSGLYALTLFFIGMDDDFVDDEMRANRPNYGTEFGDDFDHYTNRNDID